MFTKTPLELTLLENKFELVSRYGHIHYNKDLGGDGYTILHVFINVDGSFNAELEEYMYDEDDIFNSHITKCPPYPDERFITYVERLLE